MPKQNLTLMIGEFDVLKTEHDHESNLQSCTVTKHSKTAYANIGKKMYTIREKNTGQNAQWCKETGLVSSAGQLPLAFQVCSVRLSALESRPCWSREPARQSTAPRVCSGPAPRATEDKRKTTVMTASTNATGHSGNDRRPYHSAHTSCFSMRVCSSIRVSISVMFVSSTIPPMTSSDRMKWTWRIASR